MSTPTPSLADLQEQIKNLENSIDLVWISICTYLVFFMQTGFAFLEGGVIRFKNVQNILLKNLLDVIFGSFIWWLLGYAFAFGEDHSGFIGGNKYYAGTNLNSEDYRRFMFQWAFACTAATIVSGSVAERMRLGTYTFFSMFITGWVYSLVVHWGWNSDGWLKVMGYHDFAGSGVVHLAGGAAGLTATILLGPRTGRYLKVREKEFVPNNIGYIVLGTFILWFGWFGFNCGSTYGVTGPKNDLVGKVGMHTSLGGLGGGITSYLLHFFYNKNSNKKYSVPAMCNGILAGLVAITAGCDNVDSYIALFIGMMGGGLYYYLVKLLNRLQIDDPLDASAMHGGCGVLGVIAIGFFDLDEGLLYGDHSPRLIGVQLLGALCIASWTASWAFIYLLPYKLKEKLRIDEEEEIVGCDLTKHGQYAFILDVDKVRGIDSFDSPEEIAEKVRNASKKTHEIIKIVLAKRIEHKALENAEKKKGKFSKSMGPVHNDQEIKENEEEDQDDNFLKNGKESLLPNKEKEFIN